jgi:DNA primase
MQLLNKRQISLKTLTKFNIFKYENGEYEYFGEKVLIDDRREGIYFPIYYFKKKFVGYALRKKDDLNEKWVYSKSFKRNYFLYGLAENFDEIKKKKEVILVEGLFDCLKLVDEGFVNTVSCFGTLFTFHHFVLLYPIVNRIILIPDPDEGGDKMIKKVNEIVKNKLEVDVVRLPKGYDPDDFLIRFGKDSLNDLIRR